MSVEVIGKEESVLYICTCRNCASVLRFAEHDVFTHRYSACGHSESDAAITCPTCNGIVFVANRRKWLK